MSKIRFGAILNEVSHMSVTPNFSELTSLCLKCEEIGFHSAWLMDHLTWGPHSAVFECWTTLTALAIETSKIHIGPFFLCNSYRNPALVAKMAATLDVISKGRLEFGMGAGWKEDEYRAYGYNFEKAAQRIAQLEEAVTIIELLWSGQRVTFQGKYYRIIEAICQPKPIQSGGPNLWIGGGGEQLTLQVTAKHADVCNFTGRSTSLQTFMRKVTVLNHHCESIERDPAEIKKSVTLELILGKTEEEARERERKAPPSTSPESRFIGTPSDCISFLERFVAMGADYFMLQIEDLLSGLDLFENDVLPSFS